MSERTGATAKQIRDAAMEYFKNPNLTQDNYAEYAEWATEEAYRFASCLVKPGMVIARAADILTNEQRAAIGRVIVDLDNYDGIPCSQQRVATWDDFRSLSAIAEGGTE